ncbi:MAG: 1,4-dihydroxy-2-naphthoate polyprenyltransferase [Acidimicrobiia bacterium]
MTPFQAWTVAARVHTLPAALTPVLVGAGLAVHDGAFRIDALIWTLIGALAIQVAANFANDASDAHRGADSDGRLGPPRMVSAGVIDPRRMWLATAVAVAVAAVAGIALTMIAGPMILVIGAVSVVAMLGYVGGPRPYGYRGLGEVFVFVFFGLVATVGSRYVYDSTAPRSAWLLAIPVGMLATAILVANNYRDLETDARAGKRTLAVLLGPQRTRFLFAVLAYGAFPVIVSFGLIGWTPIATLFAAFWVPFATKPVALIQTATDGPSLIRALKLTARLHLLTGVSLAAGAAITI